jgi:hypothetical protein
MRVAKREESSLDPDRQEELDPCSEVLDVHVPAESRRRDDRVLAGLGDGDAERAWERPVGQRDHLAEAHCARGRVDLGDPKPRVGELVGEEPEAGDDCRPAPVLGLERKELHLEDVARLRSLDEDRPADRVHVREIELRHVLDTGAVVDLFVRGVAHVQLHRFARLDLENGLDRVVPDVVERVRGYIVDGRHRRDHAP